MHKTVLVPLDLSGPSAALGLATALAGRSGATLRLVTVASPRLDHEADRIELKAIGDSVQGPAVVTDIVESNDVAEALIREAGADSLLCLETRARGPLASIVLGSVAADLIGRAAHPLLLVGPATRPASSFDVLEVCVDGLDTIGPLTATAGAWARDLGMRVRLVHVWQPGGGRFHDHDAAAHALEDAARRLGADLAVNAEHQILDGPVVPTEIADDVERHGAAIVALGIRHRGNLRRRLLGSVALAVAHTTTAAVLTVPCG